MIRTMDATFACLLGLAVFGPLPSIQAQEPPSQDTLVRLPTSAVVGDHMVPTTSITTTRIASATCWKCGR